MCVYVFNQHLSHNPSFSLFHLFAQKAASPCNTPNGFYPPPTPLPSTPSPTTKALNESI